MESATTHCCQRKQCLSFSVQAQNRKSYPVGLRHKEKRRFKSDGKCHDSLLSKKTMFIFFCTSSKSEILSCRFETQREKTFQERWKVPRLTVVKENNVYLFLYKLKVENL